MVRLLCSKVGRRRTSKQTCFTYGLDFFLEQMSRVSMIYKAYYNCEKNCTVHALFEIGTELYFVSFSES